MAQTNLTLGPIFGRFSDFYRTQVYLGSDLWVASVSNYNTFVQILTDTSYTSYASYASYTSLQVIQVIESIQRR